MRLRLVVAALAAALLAACGEAPTKKVETEAIFYPAPPETPRIQFLTSIGKESDLGGGDQMQTFLFGKQESGKYLTRPFSVTHEKGRIWVADKDERQVVMIDLRTKKFNILRDPKGGAFDEPFSVFVTPDGYKFVADPGRERVVAFNERNEFFRAYGAKGQFRPVDVVVRGKRVYVCDVRDNEVEILDRETGELITKIGGEPSSAPGMFYRPSQLGLDETGRLYVTDSLNFRIEVFDEEGRFIKQIGELGDIPGTFARPKGMASDRDGHLYAVDAAFENVQVFDFESGAPLLPFAKYGEPGGSYLPIDVDVDYDNVAYFRKFADPDFKVEYLIYVANQVGADKINVYGFGKWVGAPFQ